MKLTKEEFKKYYDDEKLDLSFANPSDLANILEEEELINFFIDFVEGDYQAIASMKVGNGKFKFPVILDGQMDLWDGMTLNEVYDTFQEIQKRYINLTK